VGRLYLSLTYSISFSNKFEGYFTHPIHILKEESSRKIRIEGCSSLSPNNKKYILPEERHSAKEAPRLSGAVNGGFLHIYY